MKKSFIGFFLLLILLTTYVPKFDFSKNFNYSIKEIKVNGNSIVKDEEILKKLNFLYKENLFFLNIEKIEKKLQSETFIESYKIKKIYPDTLKITIVEKLPIAILFNKKKKFYISDKGNLINFEEIEIYENLPTVLGDKEKFYILYKNLKDIEFPLERIKSFYYFEAGRWDLLLLEDKLIKLPIGDYLFSLKNYMESNNDKNFKNFKIYDYRIKDQLILN